MSEEVVVTVENEVEVLSVTAENIVVIDSSTEENIIVVNDATIPGPRGPQGISPSVSLYNETDATIVSGVLTLNAETATSFFVTLSEDITSVVVENLPPDSKSQRIAIYFQQDEIGGYTITGWPASTKWNGGQRPSLTAEANAIDCVVLDLVGPSLIFGTAVGYKYS